ncbi:tRNA pseudouridine(55) synthase TruB [Phormidium sp. CLA17]|uniref:tRNA pseudouridine(55) synthase TruB n=1 Tax=Leptolyngbya sp. Cla-17 TaxID=2803751 RepID=UPI001491EC9F|nr:tRNA pseudouridine(55) synthase TruB [Leptolyngbya sp. Cla-17]MBM0742611.1 tRNA pseudouridine(55) synthase TruB [Leptolyngbya sp. Cla-17]
MDGFLNLNKPMDFTSHDCVAKLRRLLNTRRIGHAGTLDPTATGVLPIAIGRATRLLQFLRSDKAYRATIRFGVTTTTDDLEGEILNQQPVPDLDLAKVKTALKHFQGTIQQVPPIYSAIQVDGKRLYDLARSGKAVEVPSRTVEVSDIKIVGWQPGDFPELEIDIACGGGTYIRAIARDLGIALHTFGTLTNLIRTKSSGFDLENSLTLDQLEEQLQQNAFRPILPDEVLDHLEEIALSPILAKRWCQGQRIAPYDLPDFTTSRAPLRIHTEAGTFLGIGQLTDPPTGTILTARIVFLDSAKA